MYQYYLMPTQHNKCLALLSLKPIGGRKSQLSIILMIYVTLAFALRHYLISL